MGFLLLNYAFYVLSLFKEKGNVYASNASTDNDLDLYLEWNSKTELQLFFNNFLINHSTTFD